MIDERVARVLRGGRATIPKVEIEPGSEPGWEIVGSAARWAHNELGDGLLSAYAIGSLAHGGFRPTVSDIDLALLTDMRVDRDMDDVVAAIRARAGTLPTGLGRRLSIFHAPWSGFADPPAGARFPPIDRYDLIRYGVLLSGRDLRAEHATPPGAAPIRAQAVASALRRVTPDGIAKELRELAAGGVSVHDATKIVLWPVRLQHVCDTGEATGNAAAVDHYLELPDAGHRTLVRDALGWRDLSALPDPDGALSRIAAEIRELHGEVLGRLGDRPSLLRHDELLKRARELGA